MTALAQSGFSKLRTDIDVVRSAPESGGAPTWVVHDAFAGSYLRIGWLEREILRRWHLGDPQKIVDAITRETTLDVDLEDVAHFAEFLKSSGLVRIERSLSESTGTAGSFWRQFGSWRFPLVSPNSFLKNTLWLPRGILSPIGAVVALGMMMVVAIQLAAEWSWFKASLVALFDPSMLGQFLVILVGVKVVHELGHAWACRHYELDVPAMGVAVFFLWPFLYTDTTAAWRLTSRRQRAFVASAGVLAESVLALLALFAWCFVGDSELRQTLLFIGVVSMIFTLAVNANPFMKWDGYYVLSDLLGLENMQSRAFAFGKWWLRGAITGTPEREPEALGTRLGRFMIGYAIGSWLYRVILFTGLAILLYSFFFKLAGIALMAYVISRYLAGPVVSELREILARRKQFKWQRSNKIFVAALAVLGLLLLLPVDFSESTTAVVRPSLRTELYASAPGQVIETAVKTGDRVEAGTSLMRVSSPSLDQTRLLEKLEFQRAQNLANRVDGSRARDNRALVERQLEQQRATLARIDDLNADLSLKAPFAGKVVWQQRNLEPGRWVNTQQPLIRIIDPNTLEAIASVDSSALKRLEVGNDAVFVPDDPSQPRIKLRLTNIGVSPLSTLDHPGLALRHGGRVPVQNDGVASADELEPQGAWFALSFEPRETETSIELAHELTGRIKIDAAAAWLVAPVLRRLKHALVAESAF